MVSKQRFLENLEVKHVNLFDLFSFNLFWNSFDKQNDIHMLVFWWFRDDCELVEKGLYQFNICFLDFDNVLLDCFWFLQVLFKCTHTSKFLLTIQFHKLCPFFSYLRWQRLISFSLEHRPGLQTWTHFHRHSTFHFSH